MTIFFFIFASLFPFYVLLAYCKVGTEDGGLWNRACKFQSYFQQSNAQRQTSKNQLPTHIKKSKGPKKDKCTQVHEIKYSQVS